MHLRWRLRIFRRVAPRPSPADAGTGTGTDADAGTDTDTGTGTGAGAGAGADTDTGTGTGAGAGAEGVPDPPSLDLTGQRIAGQTINRIVRSAAEAAGLSEMNFTAHSRSETSRPRLGFSERQVSLTYTPQPVRLHAPNAKHARHGSGISCNTAHTTWHA